MSCPSIKTLKVRCFGPFEAIVRGAPARGLELRDGDRLVAFLALRANKLVPTIPIAEAFWPETGSLDSLHQTVRQARLALGEEAFRLESRKGYLKLDLEEVNADVVAFDRAILRGTPEALREAIELHSAPLLELWDDPWVRAERQKRRDQYLGALKNVAAAHRDEGDPAGAAMFLRRYLETRRTEEWVWRDLMADLMAAGERVEALRVYEQARDTLFKRIEPPEEMVRLAREVERHTSSGERQAASGERRESRNSELGTRNSVSSEPTTPRPDDPIYLPRPADQRLNDAVARFESVILVQGPAQSGKTSLLAKGLEQARDSGARVVQIDLGRLSAEELHSSQSFYQMLVYSISDQLGMGEPAADRWNPKRSPNANFEGFLRRTILQKPGIPLVMGLDEVDRLFERPYGVDVFALFRTWHNARALDPAGPWTALTLLLAYSTEARLFIADLNQSPFNVGVRVPLTDFTPEQVAALNANFGCPLKSGSEMSRFLGIVAGHPYLARAGLGEMAARSWTVDDLSRTADREDGPFGGHLRRLLGLLSRDERLAGATKDLIAGKPGLDEETFYRLRAAGVALGETERDARIRCPLYARYLERRLT